LDCLQFIRAKHFDLFFTYAREHFALSVSTLSMKLSHLCPFGKSADLFAAVSMAIADFISFLPSHHHSGNSMQPTKMKS
jgi:hypothetical protein